MPPLPPDTVVGPVLSHVEVPIVKSEAPSAEATTTEQLKIFIRNDKSWLKPPVEPPSADTSLQGRDSLTSVGDLIAADAAPRASSSCEIPVFAFDPSPLAAVLAMVKGTPAEKSARVEQFKVALMQQFEDHIEQFSSGCEDQEAARYAAEKSRQSALTAIDHAIRTAGFGSPLPSSN